MNIEISLLSFLVCIGLASLLAKAQAFSFLQERNSRFDTLDGLRGFLALSVFFHHFVITYYWKMTGQWVNPPEHYYQNYGKVGVSIFFMITGFLFISKILKSKGNIDWMKIFESRLFRIFPLYIFVILCITVIVFDNSGYQLHSSYQELIKQYIKWGFFQGSSINEFPNTNRVIASVDWTLKYEWLFYVSLPIVSFVIFKGGKFSISLVFMLSVVFFLKPFNFLSFSTKYLILFAIGGMVAGLANSKKEFSGVANSKLTSAVASFLLVSSILYPDTLDLIHILIMSFFFVLVVFGNDLFGVFRSPPALLLGEISYSIYLLHGIVLYILFTHFSMVDFSGMSSMNYSLLMPIVGMLVVLVSSITFLFIEKRFINFGRNYFLTKLITSFLGNANKALKRASR
jgi:peptidoglycan/LPS O-acetylase OafA/YrhL